MNAEPHESFIRELQNPLHFAEPCIIDSIEDVNKDDTEYCDNSEYKKDASAFVDAWQFIHENKNDESEDKEGYTFPSCNPVKRIDFIFVRNHTRLVGGRRASASIVDTKIVGREPTEDTG